LAARRRNDFKALSNILFRPILVQYLYLPVPWNHFSRRHERHRRSKAGHRADECGDAAMQPSALDFRCSGREPLGPRDFHSPPLRKKTPRVDGRKPKEEYT
jgi:hypothetical protein